MVEFKYEPWKKVVIHEVVQYPMDYFILQASQGIRKGGFGRPLMWSNGILFTSFIIQPTEEVVKEQLLGSVHWASLHFGEMKKYQKEYKTPGNVTVPIVDVSSHGIFGPMANWVKDKFMKK